MNNQQSAFLDVSSESWADIDQSTDLFTILRQRKGWTDEFLTAIEDSSHKALKDVDTMVDALEDIRISGKTITIAPDFDMDGIASGVLGYAGLKELGFNVNLHIPDYRRGHDLTPADIQEIHQQYPQTTVLLTCDGGVNSFDGVKTAHALGWTVLVTDHHQELLPGSTADITVNPCRLDETYTLKNICGAHVLYQVLETYSRTYQPTKLWEIHVLRLFAGIGTISDVMPVIYENRQLVKDSLSIARLLYSLAPKTVLNQWGDMEPDPDAIDINAASLLQLLKAPDSSHDPAYIAAFEGFAVLLKAFSQTSKIKNSDDITEEFYGYYLAPVMNSPRRIGTPLSDCFDIFTNPSLDEKLAAAHRLITNNERRKELVEQYTAELATTKQPLSPWVYFSAAPMGMLGLLANQLMHSHGHPVVVINYPTPSETLSGSARAPYWFNTISTLDPHPGLTAIGHQQACGVKIQDTDALENLAQILAEATQIAIVNLGEDIDLRGDLIFGSEATCDATLTDTEPLLELVHNIESLHPFGEGFPKPIFEFVIQAKSLSSVDRIGSNKQHLRLVTHTGFILLWWNAATEHYDNIRQLTNHSQKNTLRFLGVLQINEFRGNTQLQAVISKLL